MPHELQQFILYANPWWVNILLMMPFIAYYFWRRSGLRISRRTLITTAIFGAAFGFVEATVVVYLRAVTGMIPELPGALSNAAELLAGTDAPAQMVGVLPALLMRVELVREVATIVMLTTVAYLAVKTWRARTAVFLLAFAIWDLVYYLGLWWAIGWPGSLLAPDVLFLIPVPWSAQVWFPVLVSSLTVVAVVLATARRRQPVK